MSFFINPSWFYWLHIMDALRTMAIILMVMNVGAVLYFGLSVLVAKSSIANYPSISDGERALLPFYIKWVKISLAILPVFMAAVVFLPSKQTLIEMQVARLATKENVGLTVDAIKSAVDYIIESAKSMR